MFNISQTEQIKQTLCVCVCVCVKKKLDEEDEHKKKSDAKYANFGIDAGPQ